MFSFSDQYTKTIALGSGIPDALALEQRLLDLGLHREAFHLCAESRGRIRIRFWEPDALRAEEVIGTLRQLRN